MVVKQVQVGFYSVYRFLGRFPIWATKVMGQRFNMQTAFKDSNSEIHANLSFSQNGPFLSFKKNQIVADGSLVKASGFVGWLSFPKKKKNWQRIHDEGHNRMGQKSMAAAYNGRARPRAEASFVAHRKPIVIELGFVQQHSNQNPL